MEGVLLNLLICYNTSREHFLHDKVSLSLNCEVWLDVGNTVQHGPNSEFGRIDGAIQGDVVRQSKNNVVFHLVGQVVGVEFFTDVTEGGQ